MNILISIFYIISLFLVFLILFIVNDNKYFKINKFVFSIYIMGIYLCSNLMISYLFYYIKIKFSLLDLTIFNLIIFIILFWFLKKKKVKTIDKSFLSNFKNIENIKMFVSIILIIVACLSVCYIRFGGFNNIKYETTDPALHYKIAKTFAKTNEILDKNNSKDVMYNNFSNNMTGTYVNCGLMMNIFSNLPSYKVFVVFDIFVFIIYALTFYVTCIFICNNKKKKFVCLILTLMYIFGYPLNNLIFGFSYLGFGVYIVNLIVLTYLLYESEKINKSIFNSLKLILNFSLFFTYYLFVPVLYLAQGLYLIYNFLKDINKSNFKKLIVDGLLTLILPFILGFCYLVLPGFLDSSPGNSVSALAAEGYIYRDLISNFILVLPIIIFYVIDLIRKRKINIDTIIFVIFVCFMLYVFILGMQGKASSYYYYKLYYLFWFIVWYSIVKVYNSLEKDSLILFYSWLLSFLIIIAIAGLKLESRVQQKNINFSPTIVANSITNIYVWNANKVISGYSIIDNTKVELINKLTVNKNKCIGNGEVPVIGNFLEKLWVYSITDIVPIYKHVNGQLSGFYDDNFKIKEWNDDKQQKCLLYFNDSDDKSINIASYDIIYKNSSGYLLKKKIGD